MRNSLEKNHTSTGLFVTGVTGENSTYLNGKIKLCNQIAFVLFLLGIVYGVITIWFFSFILALFPIAGSAVAVISVFLNYKRKYYLARFLMSLGGLVACSVYHACLTSKSVQIIPSLYFATFGFALYPWVLADIREKSLLYPTVLISLAILSLQYWFNLRVPFLPGSDSPPYLNTILDWLTYICAMLICITTLLFLQKKNFDMENERDRALKLAENSCSEEKTSRQAVEKYNQKLEEQLLQTKKIEALGRLTGGVAHDLNNMMTPILGYSELLLKKLESTSPESGYANSIYKAANSAKQIVAQLLAFSRKQALVVEPLDVNELLENFQPLLRHTIRENVEIKLITDSRLPSILVDRIQFEQVILNLAVNAQDAMADGGRLSIETKAVHLDKTFYGNIADFQPGDYVLMAVSDNGTGMDKEEMQNIFDPFYTTKNKLGTGLGLSTVHGIVKQHGGQVKVYSEKGIGTTFKIYWPTTDKAPTILSGQSSHSFDTPFDGTIMLVEDDPEVCQLIEIQLENCGFSVLSALSGESALIVLEEHNYNVDLLLTDVIMKDMNGRQLYEKIIQKQPDIRVLFMSGYTDNVIADHGILKEGINLLQKPFNLSELTAKVHLAMQAE
jgi:signal transduction histidine kinase